MGSGQGREDGGGGSKDKDIRCINHLRAQLHSDSSHLFGDIFDFIRGVDIVASRAMQLHAQFNVWCQRAYVCGSAYCHRHKKVCHLVSPHIDVSGTPCTDFSSAGLRAGVEGPTLPIFMVWACVVLALGIPVVLHENVVLFPVGLLEGILGHVYHVYSFELHPWMAHSTLRFF